MLKRALLPWVRPMEEAAARHIAATHPTAIRVHGSPWVICLAGLIQTWCQDPQILTCFGDLPALQYLLSCSLAADPQQRPSLRGFMNQLQLVLMEDQLVAGLKTQLAAAVQARPVAAAEAADAQLMVKGEEEIASQEKPAAAQTLEREAVAGSITAAHAAESRVKEIEAECATAVAAAEAKAAAAEQREKAARAECAALVAAASDYVEAAQQKVQRVLAAQERAAGLHQAAREQLKQQAAASVAQMSKLEADLAELRALRLKGGAVSALAVQQKPQEAHHECLAASRFSSSSSAAADVGAPGTPTRLSESGCADPAAASTTTTSSSSSRRSSRSSSSALSFAPAMSQRSDTRPFMSPVPVQGNSRARNPFRIDMKLSTDSWCKQISGERQQHQARIAKGEVKPWYAVFPALWL
jgi:hypothetical protein